MTYTQDEIEQAIDGLSETAIKMIKTRGIIAGKYKPDSPYDIGTKQLVKKKLFEAKHGRYYITDLGRAVKARLP